MLLVRVGKIEDFGENLVVTEERNYDLCIRMTKSGIMYNHIEKILKVYDKNHKSDDYKAINNRTMLTRLRNFMNDVDVDDEEKKRI